MELINLKSVSLLNFEKLKKKLIEAEIKKLVEANNEHQRNL
jgi:hypothetical protein